MQEINIFFYRGEREKRQYLNIFLSLFSKSLSNSLIINIFILGSVNSIHNKWDLTFKIDTNFGEFEDLIHDFIKTVDLEQPTFPPEDIR